MAVSVNDIRIIDMQCESREKKSYATLNSSKIAE